MPKGLPDLLEVIDDELERLPQLKLEVNQVHLELSLDLGQGLGEYEDLNIAPQKENFRIKYFGLINPAKNTLMQNLIGSDSRLVQNFRRRVNNIDRNKMGYSQLVYLIEYGKFDETFEALDFFYNAFKIKARIQRPKNWR